MRGWGGGRGEGGSGKVGGGRGERLGCERCVSTPSRRWEVAKRFVVVVVVDVCAVGWVIQSIMRLS